MKKILYTLLFFATFLGTKTPVLAQNAAHAERLGPQKAPTATKTEPFQTGITTPPNGPVRTMAEWEELQAVLIAWQGQATLLTQIVKEAHQECQVIVLCNSGSTLNSARNTLLAAQVDTSKVDLVVIPNNSIWIRDYGPTSIYKNDVDSLFLVDWIYNRNRPSDDTSAAKIAQHIATSLYSTTVQPNDLVHTGGNFMTDGMGTAFSSKLVLEENGPSNTYGISNHSEAAVDDILYRFMGVNEYIKMNALPFDVINHIDMHMKLLDEETLLVGEYPVGVADGPQIEANIQYVLSNFRSSFGTPYKVVRIPMPPDAQNRYPDNSGQYRTYANAVILNKTILVPFYQERYDTVAQRIWETSMPGYRVKGINCNSIIGSLGAIHCITKEVGVQNPLRIVHQELACADDTHIGGYAVRALIQHNSGIESAEVFWATNASGPFFSSTLEADTTEAGYFMGEIPQQAEGTTIYYYIQATANSGKTMVRPMPAPAGTWSFCVPETVVASSAPAPVTLQAIFPNPAAAVTCVPVFSEKRATADILLLNALGQEVRRIHTGDLPQGESKYFFDANALSPGCYWVQVRSGNATSVQQVIVR